MNRAARILSLDTTVTTPDGAALATDVTVADDGQRHPVLLIRTPYGRASVRGMHDAIGLARLGFAVVTQDVRGRWDSGGAFSPFQSERADGAHTVDWCASQPWSNGAVAMAGASYNGFTQWLALAERPAALRVVAPSVAGPDIRSAVYEGGALQLGVFSSWTLGIGALGSNLDGDIRRASIGALDTWPASIDHDHDVLARISPNWGRWLSPDGSGPSGAVLAGAPGANPDGAAGRRASDGAVGADGVDGVDGAAFADADLWGPLDATPALAGGTDVAGYHLAGWHDLFCESTIRGYTLLAGAEEQTAKRQRLVVGPWSHATMLRRTTGQLDFGVTAQGDFNGLVEEQVAFAAAGMAGGDVPHGVRVYVMGANRWLDLDAWPPTRDTVTLHLAADGRLESSPPQTTGADHYRHDPTDPVPTSGGRTLHPVLPEAGPRDQRAVEERRDVLVYTGEVLPADLTVLGTVRAQLTFASSAPVTDVTVKLVDVHPDGAAMLVVDSIRRVRATPGSTSEVEVEVGSTAMTFAAGHRVRIEIASSNYPRFDLSPAADQTVRHGGRATSRIVLPTYAGSLR
ncbi:CocE/NonD family hydrolase [Actinopolymorpha pittospori]|uniref:Acyl esterase n=1 Tax=Actinopolymorpha pittospori TaxID=648752 RepID=A0A927N687_9ACTN|nr:putative acyl esterase [Actinopolymorpha pittospori]